MDNYGAGVRNGILNLKLKEQQDLYRAYMPFVEHGGLFIPTKKEYMLGDEVFVLLDLIDESERIPVTGKVIWVTPKGMGGNRNQGVGLKLDSKHDDLMKKIEAHLAGMLDSDKPTATM
ncbi:MAG: PilZ domain-containing protein [Pseudomonadales bacterium]|nr:PilZ domain-containing protein [Pseudomonadales bacterium]MCP5171583.1 PilZ domain-containing protein [Pseudomonadales bacterium]